MDTQYACADGRPQSSPPVTLSVTVTIDYATTCSCLIYAVTRVFLSYTPADSSQTSSRQLSAVQLS